MFNRFLASIGIGSANIDTLLEKAQYSPGEEVRGIVRIRGGSVEQRIETISLSVMTEYIKESDDNKYRQHGEVARFHVSSPFTVQAGENRDVPFSFILPYQTPVTIGRAPVWIKTELDVRGGVDPGGKRRASPARQSGCAKPSANTLISLAEGCLSCRSSNLSRRRNSGDSSMSWRLFSMEESASLNCCCRSTGARAGCPACSRRRWIWTNRSSAPVSPMSSLRRGRTQSRISSRISSGVTAN